MEMIDPRIELGPPADDPVKFIKSDRGAFIPHDHAVHPALPGVIKEDFISAVDFPFDGFPHDLDNLLFRHAFADLGQVFLVAFDLRVETRTQRQ